MQSGTRGSGGCEAGLTADGKFMFLGGGRSPSGLKTVNGKQLSLKSYRYRYLFNHTHEVRVVAGTAEVPEFG